MDQGLEGRSHGFRRTAVADVSAEPDGLIVLRFDQDCRITESAAAEVAAAHVALASGSRGPVLVDMRGVLSADRGTRELAAGPDVSAVTARLAILVGNPVTRVLGNFFLRVSAPKYPTRIFNDETLARAWLREA